MSTVSRRPLDGWAATSVDSVTVRVTKGTTPTTMGFAYRNDGIRFVKVEAIENYRIVHERCMFIGPDAHEALSRSKLLPGDVLISIAGTLGRVAIVAERDVPANTNQALAIVRPDAAVLPAYLAHALDSSLTRNAVSEAGRGIGLQNLNLEQVANLPLLVAPLPEQHRIVEAIESYFTRLADAVATLERVQRNLKRYRASVLKAAVEGRLVPTEAELARAEGRDYEPASVLLEGILVERRHRWDVSDRRGRYEEPETPDITGLPALPEGWCWTTAEALSDATRPISYGVIKLGGALEGGIPVLRSSNVRHLQLDLGYVKPVSEEIETEFRRTRLQGHELLVTVRGTLGGVAVVPDTCRDFNISREVAMVALVERRIASTIATFIASPFLQTWMLRRTRGITYQGVNIETLKMLPIPLPPLAEQDRIVAEVERYLSISEAAISAARTSVLRCQRLRQSILKWAFEGKLADQDPSDEPASALLQRIRSQTSASRQSASDADERPRRRRGSRSSVRAKNKP